MRYDSDASTSDDDISLSTIDISDCLDEIEDHTNYIDQTHTPVSSITNVPIFDISDSEDKTENEIIIPKLESNTSDNSSHIEQSSIRTYNY